MEKSVSLSLFMSLRFGTTFGLVFCLSSDVREKNVLYLKVLYVFFQE